MNSQSQEARILLAIQAIRTSQEMSIRCAAKTYDVPQTTLRDRMKGRTSKAENRNAQHNLTPTEEETLIRYILDLDSRGFPPRINDVRDMADLLRIRIEREESMVDGNSSGIRSWAYEHVTWHENGGLHIRVDALA